MRTSVEKRVVFHVCVDINVVNRVVSLKKKKFRRMKGKKPKTNMVGSGSQMAVF